MQQEEEPLVPFIKRTKLYQKYTEQRAKAQVKYAKWNGYAQQIRTFGVGFQYGVCFGIPYSFYAIVRR